MNFIIAQVIGVFAIIFLILSFQNNDEKKLLKFQIMSSLSYAIQYIFLGAYTGVYMNLLCMIRNIIFSKYNKKIPIGWLIIIIIGVIFFSMLTYTSDICLLPMIGVILYSFSLWYGNLRVIRISEAIGATTYIIYNICVFAYTGVIASGVELLGTLVAIYRFDIKK